MNKSDSTVRFRLCAEDFCHFVAEAHAFALPERIRRAQRVLLAVYRAALELPDVEPGDEEPEDAATKPPTWPGMGEVDGYWEAFDPYKLDEPVAGSLSDDILDIYSDLRCGLDLLSRHGDAALPSAAWYWRFNFDTHWGDHAVDALRALHRAVR